MAKKRVVVTDYNFPHLNIEKEILQDLELDFQAYQCQREEDLTSALENADIAFVQFAKITKKVMVHMNSPATIIRYGVGYDNIDLASANELGIRVAYVPDYCSSEVADHTVALVLSLLRNLVSLDHSVREGKWQTVQTAGKILPFAKTTLGFLGFGRIAQEVFHRLEAFGFDFLAYDPVFSKDKNYWENKQENKKIRAVELDFLLKHSDLLCLHANANPNTQKIINAQTLSKMKDSAMLVNTSRGELIDEQALAHALRIGKIRAVGLDVFTTEPIHPDSPLRFAPNVLFTPHAAWYSTESIQNLQRLAGEEARRALLGEALRCPVDLTPVQ